LPTPRILVWGDRDAFASPRYGEPLAARSPNARLVRVAGAGHRPWFDDPERVVGEIEHFTAAEPAQAVLTK
jgi:pimeloyl-ACP methyl ester carboxylesterase